MRPAQVIKQVTNNPNPASALRGWQLMCVLLVCASPSDDLRPYMLSVCDAAAAEPALGGVARCRVAARASAVRLLDRPPFTLALRPCARRSYAVHLLREMAGVPQRTEMPSPLELDAIAARTPLLVRVCVRAHRPAPARGRFCRTASRVCVCAQLPS